METIMSDLLKEAIADAKAVRETALQNAKMALEEAFTPHLKSMLSAKLAEDDIEEDDNPFADKDEDEEEAEDMARYEEEGDEDPNPFADDDEESEPEMEPEMEEEGIIEIDGVKYAPVVSEEDEEEMEYDAEADDSEELDLEAVIKELELEIAESDESDEDLEEEAVEETVNITEEEDEDEDEKEVDEQSTPESEEDTEVHESVNAMQTELNEYKEAVTYLRDKLHEVNILNAKLLYTNRLFKEFALSNNQKMKIVETFDRAQTTREIKLVYSTLAESYSDTGSVKKNEIKEFASKKAGTTAPKTKIISEENQVADRFKKLAGILND
ncbi:hypothetical protein HOE22_13185 [Candidatus Woesearchaeota archaeon]|nr:hypothetical protein [Candidatus Woesearchaeota archaeon]